MKKILSLALVLTMILSCFAINASANVTLTMSAKEADDIIEVNFSLAGVSTLYAINIDLAYNPAVVMPANSSGTTSAGSANGTKYNGALIGRHTTEKEYNDNEGDDIKLWDDQGLYVFSDKVATGTSLVRYSLNMASAWAEDPYGWKANDIADPFNVITIRFKKVADGDANFAVQATDASKGILGTLYQADADSAKAEATLDDQINVGGDEPIVPPVVDNNTVQVATETVDANGFTFAGKIHADKFNNGDVEYGVVVNGKKFFGAKSGDMVSDGADGVTEFTYGDWTGEFEIKLINVANDVNKKDSVTATGYYFVGAETQNFTNDNLTANK